MRRGRPARQLGALAGVPFAVKNLFDIAGLPTRAGSKINRDRPPAARDAVLIERLDSRRRRARRRPQHGRIRLRLHRRERARRRLPQSARPRPHVRAAPRPARARPPRRAWRRSPSVRTRTARSGCRARSAASSASSRPTAGCRGRAPFRSATASTISGHWRARRATSRSPTTRCRATIRTIRPAPAPGRADAAEARARRRGLARRRRRRLFRDRREPEARGCGRRGRGGARRAAELVDGRRRRGGGRAAAFLITNAESAAFHLERLRSRADDFDPETRDRFLAGALLPAAWVVAGATRPPLVSRAGHGAVSGVDLIVAPATPVPRPARSARSAWTR